MSEIIKKMRTENTVFLACVQLYVCICGRTHNRGTVASIEEGRGRTWHFGDARIHTLALR